MRSPAASAWRFNSCRLPRRSLVKWVTITSPGFRGGSWSVRTLSARVPGPLHRGPQAAAGRLLAHAQVVAAERGPEQATARAVGLVQELDHAADLRALLLGAQRRQARVVQRVGVDGVAELAECLEELGVGSHRPLVEEHRDRACRWWSGTRARAGSATVPSSMVTKMTGSVVSMPKTSGAPPSAEPSGCRCSGRAWSSAWAAGVVVVSGTDGGGRLEQRLGDGGVAWWPSQSPP